MAALRTLAAVRHGGHRLAPTWQWLARDAECGVLRQPGLLRSLCGWAVPASGARATMAPRRLDAAASAAVRAGATSRAGLWRGGSAVRWHGNSDSDDDVPESEMINVTYVNKDGSETHVKGKPGQNLLRLAQKHDVELEGACECSIACSTCHVVVDDEYYDLLPEASEEEEDMLDLAFGLEPTSRLGCQVVLTDELDGIRVTLPQATRNFYVDGHVPQPH